MKIVVKKDSTLLDYLYENLDIPKKRIKQYLTHGAIFVNNNRTTKYCALLLTIYTFNELITFKNLEAFFT